MNNLKARIHDKCLEYEINILESVEQLENQRNKNYETGKVEDLKLITPILNDISYEVDRYKEYIQEAKSKIEDQGGIE